jgi:hypothetical protein
MYHARTCGDVFRGRVAIGAHDAGGDVAPPAFGTVLGESKVRELRVEVLQSKRAERKRFSS